MASQNQIRANQINAEMSTGPRTEEGKAVVSSNALKHGLLSKETLLPDEDASGLDELRRQLGLALEPANEIEAVLVERIVSLTWRLKRAGRIEAALFVIEQIEKRERSAKNELSKYRKTIFGLGSGLDDLEKITDPKNHEIAKAKLEAVRAEASGDLPSLGHGFVKNMVFIEKLQRYETSIERSLFKALHELQRIQAFRLGLPAAVPVAIDMHGDAVE
jgi:hypothetical protein